jgi:hypothetical protein
MVRSDYDSTNIKDMAARTTLLFRLAKELKWLSDIYKTCIVVINQVTGFTLLLHHHYTLIPPLLHSYYTLITLLLHSYYTIITPLLHSYYIIIILLLHHHYILLHL